MPKAEVLQSMKENAMINRVGGAKSKNKKLTVLIRRK